MSKTPRHKHRKVPQQRQIRTLRPADLPGPTAGQVARAQRSVSKRTVPQWSDATAHKYFLRWFATIENPFAQAYVNSFPEIRPGMMLEPDPELNATLKRHAADAIEGFEVAQSKALDDLISVIGDLDPLPLLCGVILLTRIESWGSYFEPRQAPRHFDIELIGCIIMGRSADMRRTVSVDDLMTVRHAAALVHMWAEALSVAYSYAAESDVKSRTRTDVLSRWFSWRGSAYTHHAVAAARRLAAHHESSLVARIGFNVEDIIRLASSLQRQWEFSITSALNSAWEHAKNVTGEIPDKLDSSSTRFKVEWIGEAMRLLPGALGIPLDGKPHLLGAGGAMREAAILKELGTRPGGTGPVTSVLVDPPQRTRPFILLPAPLGTEDPMDGAEVALLINPEGLSTDLHLTAESLMAHIFPKWPAARARAVDQHAVDLLQRGLPGSKSFTNVFMDGPTGRIEMDGIIVYEDIAVVVEGKGAPLKLAARRGSIDKLVAQLQELITEGTEQLERDRNYLINERPARFYDHSGTCILEVDGAALRRCYSILPTIDGLGDVGTALPRLAELGILSPGARPWIVGITDLNIVTDILRRPADLSRVHGIPRDVGR